MAPENRTKTVLVVAGKCQQWQNKQINKGKYSITRTINQIYQWLGLKGCRCRKKGEESQKVAKHWVLKPKALLLFILSVTVHLSGIDLGSAVQSHWLTE